MKIEQVTIEGLNDVTMKTYRFDKNLTYLYGENGAGKTTVLNAIQLALLGYIPGTSKTNQAIFRHSNGREISISVFLEDDNKDSIIVKRGWIRIGDTISTEFITSPERYDINSIISEIELPIFNFGELLNLTPNKLKDWFIQSLSVNNKSEVDWRIELKQACTNITNFDESLIDRLLETIEEYEEEGIDLVIAVNSLVKDEQKFIKSKITNLQSTINSLIYYDDAPEQDEVEIKKCIEDNMKLSNDLAVYQSALSRYNNSKESVEVAKSKCNSTSLYEDNEYISLTEALNEDVIDHSEEIQNLSVNISDLKSEIASAASVINSNGVCPYTKVTCESISEQIKQMIRGNAEKTKQIEELSLKLSELRNIQDKQARERNTKEQRKQEIEYNYKVLSNVISSSIEYEPIKPTENTIEEIKAVIESLQTDLAKIESNKRYNSLIETITKDKFDCEMQIAAYKAWDKLTSANGLQSRLSKDAFLNLETVITSNLNKMTDKEVKAAFNLAEKANSFSFGWIKNNKYIPYDLLSSGEKCIYTFALMMTIMGQSKSMLKVMMIDDIIDHLDNKNAKLIFESLQKIDDIQFILAGVKECVCENASEIVQKVGE